MNSVRRAGITNAAFRLGSSGLNFLLVPVFLRIYGLQTYGSLSLLLSLGQYISFLDLGFSSALVREFLRLRSDGDGSYFLLRRTTVVAVTLFGGLVTTLAASTAHYWGPSLNVSDVGDLSQGVYGAGLVTIFSLIAGVLNSAFVASLKFAHANSVTILVNLVPQLACLAAYVSGRSLGTSLLIAGLGTGLVVVVQVLVLQREEKGIGLPGASPNWQGVGQFARASIGFSLQTITSAMTIPVLQTIIGIKLGPQANGLFDASRRLLFAGRQAVEALFVPVFARTTDLLNRGNVSEIRHLAKRATGSSLAAAAAFFLAFLVLLPSIVGAWLGAGRASPVLDAARLFLTGVAFTCPHIGVYQVLSAFPEGRRANVVAGTFSLLVLLLGFSSPVRSLADVAVVYTVATLTGSVVTFVLAFRLLSGSRTSELLADPGFKS